MRNPFDRLSELSVDRPKTAIAVAVIGILALSSFAQFIVFDNRRTLSTRRTRRPPTVRGGGHIHRGHRPDQGYR